MPLYNLSLFQERIEASGRLLGIDWGKRRIGLAVSDGLRLLAHPLETRVRSSFQGDVQHLRGHLQTYQIQGIVIGLPCSDDGTFSSSASVVSIRSWVHRLSSCIPLPMVFCDEASSSQEAEALLYGGQVSQARRTQSQDQYAAALILQRFLDQYLKKEWS